MPINQVSLSTMWAVHRCDGARDFVRQARAMGFSHVEANYQLSSEMVTELLGMPDRRVLSVHSPCPSALVREGLWSYKIPLNAPDMELRALAVKHAVDSIALAAHLGAGAVVLHLGAVPEPPGPDGGETLQARLRRLYKEGHRGSPEHLETRDALAAWRERARGPHLEAANQVLRILAKQAAERGIALGLEARYYYHEIPSFEEMGWLLAEHPRETVGYWHDVGHAENLERLGFATHGQWLTAYGPRMIGVHLHDIVGLKDHYAPGLGELDYAMVARHLPAEAIRVCEVDAINDEASLVAGLHRLAETGIISI